MESLTIKYIEVHNAGLESEKLTTEAKTTISDCGLRIGGRRKARGK